MAWRLEDGVMQCSFRRNITLPGDKNRFDLNTSYYIFLADGAADDGKYYILIKAVFSSFFVLFFAFLLCFRGTTVIAHF